MTEQRISDETLAQGITTLRARLPGRTWITPELQAILVMEDLRDARAALAEAQREPLRLRAADALADEVAVLIKNRVIDSRSPAADALLDYRDPPRTERSDALAEAQRENERLKAELSASRADANAGWAEASALIDAIRPVRAWYNDIPGDPGDEVTLALSALDAILNTAAGSAAWLAAHDAETKAPLLQTIENERAQFQRETLRTSECYRLIREMCEVIENTPDAHAHEPDAAAARIGRPGECPRCRLVADARALLARPINDTGSAEKDAQIAALVEALREFMDTLSIDVSNETHAKADAALANLPAAAAAYTADVRRAALEEAAKIADEQSLRYRSDAERSAAARQYGKWSEADGGAILAEFIARDIRALAAQPEGQ